MATSVLGLKTFASSDPVDYNEVNDNYVKIDNGVKTAMQGRAAQNLLDNSWFVKPVNQRGKTTYEGVANASVYTIDRWTFSWQGGAVLTVGDGYIQHNGYKLQQYFEKSLDTNKTYTAAICLTDGTKYVYSGNPSDGFGSWDNTIWVNSSYFRIEKGLTQPIKWAALYKGSYTADTLPAYVPKGYAAELAECQRYYLPLNHQLLGSGYTFPDGATLLVPRKMRIDAPSFVASGTITARVNGANYPLTLSSVTTYGSMIKVDFASNTIPVNYPCAFYADAPGVSLNADL